MALVGVLERGVELAEHLEVAPAAPGSLDAGHGVAAAADVSSAPPDPQDRLAEGRRGRLLMSARVESVPFARAQRQIAGDSGSWGAKSRGARTRAAMGK